MMRFIKVLFVYFTFNSIISGQKTDYLWYFGIESRSKEIDTLWTPALLNFNHDPMKLEWAVDKNMRFDATNASFCHDDGKLFCLSNGMSIDGFNHQPLLSGDTINYGGFWELWRAIVSTGNLVSFGFTIPQGMIMLPWPGSRDSIFYCTAYSDDKLEDVNLASYGCISKKIDNGRGGIVMKDKIFHQGALKNSVQAVRHANGRDWWIILIEHTNEDFHFFLLDNLGLHAQGKQKIGLHHQGIFLGNASFSADGNKFAHIDALIWNNSTIISLFDFDRCSGTLSNPVFDTIPTYEAGLGIGISFSPNSRYLYANNDYQLFQYDTGAKDVKASRILLDTFDGFQSVPHESLYYTTFGYWATGPDGRLYNVSGYGTAKHIHIMHYPNEGGKEAAFRQHDLRIGNNHWSIPNFPHYRLGPLDGSSCDTLGLDNHPIAKYRYEADSIDYLRLRFTDLSYFRPETWSWDFGDGSPRVSMQSPYHTFAQKGTYNVCLTVSNENSSNTVCRTITLGPSSSDNESVRRADISLFPNPVQDFLLVTLGEYVPAYGQIMIYDITGRPVITQRIYYGQNSVDMRSLQAGMYVWKVVDGTQVVREGKVVKI